MLLVRGQALLVLGISWLVWLLYQLFPEQTSLAWPIVGNNLFYFAAWQVLFFSGLAISGSARSRCPARPVWAVWPVG